MSYLSYLILLDLIRLYITFYCSSCFSANIEYNAEDNSVNTERNILSCSYIKHTCPVCVPLYRCLALNSPTCLVEERSSPSSFLMELRRRHTACLSLNPNLAIMSASTTLVVNFVKSPSPSENVPLTKFPFCSFMQFHTKPLQSDWPVSLEFIERD